MNITEDYCSFEVAKLLKEKGFNESIETLIGPEEIIYHLDENSISRQIHSTISNSEINIYSKDVSCPTTQMAMKWLREIHSLHIVISIGSDSSTDADGNIIEEWHYWTYSIRYTIDGHIIYDNDSLLGTEYQSYEEAVESAIKYCLTNLI